MNRTLVFLFVFLFIASAPPAHSQPAQVSSPDETDLKILQVSEGIVQLFRQFPDSIWPGYDLAGTPFAVYRPGKWALLLGSLHDVGEFSVYPLNWPDLGHPLRFHQGQYGNLIGQIVFDFPIDDTTTVAVGLPDATPEMAGLEHYSYEEYIFGFIVHEAFHQYQYAAFGEIPWEREERYPILNTDNTAAAVLEMRLLMNALEAAADNDVEKCEDFAKMFTAVRKHRWNATPGFVERFERGLEIREGTAEYVEVRALDRVKQLRYHSDIPASRPLPDKMQDVSAFDLVQMDFEARFTDGSVSPEDMPRNRIYPVGAAQGLLLDFLDVDWREAAQGAGEESSMVDLLIDRLEVNADSLSGLLAQAHSVGGFEEIVEATDRRAESYLQGYSQAFEAFESQPGYKIEIRTKRSGVSRSRVTPQRKWLMNEGRFQLCLGYDTYSLSSHDLLVQIKDNGLLEKNDWEEGIRTVTVYVDHDLELKLDGEEQVLGCVGSQSSDAEGEDHKTPDPPEGEGELGRSPVPEQNFSYRFEEIDLEAGSLFLQCSIPGHIDCKGDVITINLTGE